MLSVNPSDVVTYSLFLKVVWFGHLAWHLIATTAVLLSFVHSYKKHKPSRWKIFAALLWLVVSAQIIVLSLTEQCN